MKKHRALMALSTAVAAAALILAGTPATAASNDDTTLREEAAKAGILIGSGAVNPTYLDDPQFAQVLGEQFNSLSPENELKWSFVEPEKGVFDFDGLDKLVDYAHKHHMVIKGHGLISGCCNPDYVTQITDPDQMRAALTDHFNAVMGRYADTMDRWDVVTEMIDTQGTELQHNDFYRVLGPGYIAEAFRIAHAANPHAKLFINENLVEFLPAKRQALYDLVAGLVADGVPIDGVGLQMHETLAGPQPGVITDIVNSYKKLGLQVAITELDVHTYDDAQQAQIYGDVIAESLAAGITDISTWGFTDKYLYTWLPGAKPLMFDENYQPKSAYFASRQALSAFVAAPTAPGKATLSSTSGHTSGLHDGNYTVNMNLWHGTPGSFYRLYENGVLVAAHVPTTLSPTSQTAETVFTDKPNGTYVYRAELINSHGVVSTNTTTVKVTDAAPGKVVVSHDNWDNDGNFTVTGNLWWGTNATSYTFLLDGAAVASGTLTANTPNAQTAQAALTGVGPGTHTLQVVFSNSNGSSTSKEVKVVVR